MATRRGVAATQRTSRAQDQADARMHVRETTFCFGRSDFHELTYWPAATRAILDRLKARVVVGDSAAKTALVEMVTTARFDALRRGVDGAFSRKLLSDADVAQMSKFDLRKVVLYAGPYAEVDMPEAQWAKWLLDTALKTMKAKDPRVFDLYQEQVAEGAVPDRAIINAIKQRRRELVLPSGELPPHLRIHVTQASYCFGHRDLHELTGWPTATRRILGRLEERVAAGDSAAAATLEELVTTAGFYAVHVGLDMAFARTRVLMSDADVAQLSASELRKVVLYAGPYAEVDMPEAQWAKELLDAALKTMKAKDPRFFDLYQKQVDEGVAPDRAIVNAINPRRSEVGGTVGTAQGASNKALAAAATEGGSHRRHRRASARTARPLS